MAFVNGRSVSVSSCRGGRKYVRASTVGLRAIRFGILRYLANVTDDGHYERSMVKVDKEKVW